MLEEFAQHALRRRPHRPTARTSLAAGERVVVLVIVVLVDEIVGIEVVVDGVIMCLC